MADITRTDPQDLVEAFQLFTEVSGQLTNVYETLQAQVAQLTDELAAANLQLRQQLDEKERLSRRLDLVLNLLPGAVLVLDEEEAIQDANAQARRIFGDLIVKGTRWRSLLATHLRDLGQGEWGLSTGAVETEKRLSISINYLPEGGGRILLVQDVTETQRMREAVQRQKRLYAMGEMLANLAHQLRTPLAAALLYASRLQEGELDDEVRARFAERLAKRLRHLEALINDMLRFVKGDTDAGQSVALSQLLDELGHITDHVFRQKGVELVLVNTVGEASVLGGRELLSGLLSNLLNNACQFSPPGAQVHLQVDCRNGMLEFSVRDDGPGIPLSRQERLFEPFYTTRADGTGLGLAIVREAVTQLGGSVWVASRPGAGAIFGMRLPMCQLGAPALSGAALQASLGEGYV